MNSKLPPKKGSYFCYTSKTSLCSFLKKKKKLWFIYLEQPWKPTEVLVCFISLIPGWMRTEKHPKTATKITLIQVSFVFDTCHFPLFGKKAQNSEGRHASSWFFSCKIVNLYYLVPKLIDKCQFVSKVPTCKIVDYVSMFLRFWVAKVP